MIEELKNIDKLKCTLCDGPLKTGFGGWYDWPLGKVCSPCGDFIHEINHALKNCEGPWENE